MATQNDSTFREGQSTTRPPYFDGNDYPYWKTRMRIYLQALDYEIWEIVNDGPFMPLTENEVGEDIPKPSREWNEFEKRKAFLNSKAMNALFCALDKKEFYRVSSCESANEIWHKLEVVYKGTNQVKESKISRYTRQYELFQMEQNENVYSMYTRFTDIVNTLGALGKTFSNSEKVKKIIRSLPKEWRPKRTAIEKAKDLNVLPIDDLIGSLISYEEDLAAEKGHEEKKKNIALKASKRESDEESEMDDEELAMLARRFRKFYKKNNEQRKFRGYKNKKEKKEPITCYEYNLGKFDPKSDVGIFLGYSNSSKAYRVYNKRTLVVEESMHVTFDESNPSSTEKVVVNDNAEEEQQEEASNDNQKGELHGIQEEHHEETNAEQNEGTSQTLPKEWSVVVRNKARLVAQGYNQEEGIDFDETFAPVARGTHIDLTCYSDVDFAGYKVDRKSTSGTCHFLGHSLVSWFCKKQNSVALSTTEAEYIAADVGWLNALVFEENVYPDLVKVFYSNMDCSAEKENRIITTVGGVSIEFDDSELNSILGTSDDGLEMFSPRKPPDIDDYVYIDTVKNICRRIDLSDEDCTIC
ncbi:hypothetical protein KPL71_008242 [Citrus sinensis]|uniref:Uncharacterized protein n=1 Tax=Citrus sinensis TaxID=2711 RepID=A0ACB8M5S3_CITSI|nr:hypothetical protein KPL71_008242 [Citrus sinensis]